jgi:hypothetical protein
MIPGTTVDDSRDVAEDGEQQPDPELHLIIWIDEPEVISGFPN